eukprot:TRINITY_DN18315_c0_g2_i1.p1 TRINITY_DN18315_c0_g2~~TRINITY_DN18315_c0_g2_i1.p1  ORF type:complete len:432 (+),score=106.18 TRINITY_DN18315_c0_g2_i1:133-1428(+)
MGKGIRYRCSCGVYFNKAELMAHLDVTEINVHDPKFYDRCPDRHRRKPKRSVEAFLEQVKAERAAEADRAASVAGTAEAMGASRNRASAGVTASMDWPAEPKAVFNKTNPVKPPLKKTAWQEAANGDPLADSLKWGDGPRGKLRKSAFQQCMTDGVLNDRKWDQGDRGRLKKSAWAQSMTESDLPDKDFSFSASPEKNVGRTRAQIKRDKEEAMLHNPLLGERRFDKAPKQGPKAPPTTWERMVARERAEAKEKVDEEKARKSRMAQHLASEIKRAAHAYAQHSKSGLGTGQHQPASPPPKTPPRPRSPMQAFASAEKADPPNGMRKGPPRQRPTHAERLAGQALRSKAHRHRSSINATQKPPPGPTRWVPTGDRAKGAAKGEGKDVTGSIAGATGASRRARGSADVTGKPNAPKAPPPPAPAAGGLTDID